MVNGPASENAGGGQSSWGQSSMGTSRFCAYNQTRERFISTDVECADFSAASLQDRLPALTPGCRIALWINPFRGISETSVRVPIDLIYLDRNFVVLDTVESFPIFQVGDSSVPAASVLALSAEIIGSTETRRGDQLIVCAPEELRRRLLEASGTGTGSGAPEPARSQPVSASPVADTLAARPSVEESGKDAAPNAATDAPAMDSQKSTWKKETPKRSWLQRLLADEPPDPRGAPREALSWITAYFFTGGTPKAHGIRDISATGVFVLTEERWYPGTVIRMTLTDQRRPTSDRSLTVNAEVVRWGNDGVGLKFQLSDKKAPRRGKEVGVADSVEELRRDQVEQFLEQVRVGAAPR